MFRADWVLWVSWGVVIYAYLGFPLILALVARFFGRESHPEAVQADPDELPHVAMVVAAYNERAVLPAKLANFAAIDYPKDRITLVIGSDGSEDGTSELLAECTDPRLKPFVFKERRGKISVLNDLVRETGAEILIMSDANTMFAPDAVRKLVVHFQDSRVGCVSGELCLEQEGGVSGEGLYWKYEGWIKRNESRLGFLIGCNGGIFALRRALYQPLPKSTVIEDFVLCMRVLERGFHVRFEPAARGVEPACPSSRAEMVRKIRIGAGGFQALALTSPLLLPQYGLRAFAYWGHKVIRWVVPLFLVLGFLANCMLVDQPLYALLLLLQLAGALVAALAYRARPGGVPRWTRPVSYFYLMNYALLCGLVRFVFRTQRVTWDRASR